MIATDLKPIPAAHRLPLGSMAVTTCLDGWFLADAASMTSISPEVYAAALAASRVPGPDYRSPINAFVLDTPTGPVLFDAGAGSSLGPGSGHLQGALKAAGYDARDIRAVLVTHMHPDHVGGLVDADGGAAFPCAELVLPQAEWEFCNDQATPSSVPAAMEPFLRLARAAGLAYGSRRRLFAATETEVWPGVRSVPLAGHSPGHTGYLVGSGDEGLLVWGDVVHAAPLQMARPEVGYLYDWDPELATAVRRRMLAEAARSGTMVAGMHLPFPGFGHVVEDGSSYRFEAGSWRY